MKKINVSTKQMDKFEGQWVAIDPQKDKIIAASETFEDIASLVSGKVKDKNKIKAYSFKVPRKDEGHYVLPQL